MPSKQEKKVKRMEVSQQKVTIVGTEGQKKRLTKGKMIRFRADPITVYELNQIMGKTNLDMSATIRMVIHSFKDIDVSLEVIQKWHNLRLAEALFKAAVEAKESSIQAKQ